MSSDSSPPPASSWIALLAMIAAIAVVVFTVALCVGSGGQAVEISMAEGKYGPHFETYFDFEYGWPLPFLRREDQSEWVAGQTIEKWGHKEFHVAALSIDLVVAGVLIAAGIGFIFYWRRTRQHLLQIYLSEILILTGLVACAAGWLTWNHQVHAAEEKIVRELTPPPEYYMDVTWQPGGPWWLRKLIGGQWFADFDRVVAIGVPPDEVRKLPGLQSLRVVRIQSQVSDEELQVLEQLPQLEALDCMLGVFPAGEGNSPTILLPRLPHLRGLNLYWGGAALHPECGDRLPQLEVIDLSDHDGMVESNDVSIDALIKMKHLRRLSISTYNLSPAGLARLRKELPRCEINGEPASSGSP